MCCQILQEDGHYAMNARISIFPVDKCYLLSVGLVKFNKSLALSVSLPNVQQKILISLYGFVLLGLYTLPHAKIL